MPDYAPLTLHVPEPAVRPGGSPDFSSVRIPDAGSVARPEVNAAPESIRDLAYSIIRVLDMLCAGCRYYRGFFSFFFCHPLITTAC